MAAETEERAAGHGTTAYVLLFGTLGQQFHYRITSLRDDGIHSFRHECLKSIVYRGCQDLLGPRWLARRWNMIASADLQNTTKSDDVVEIAHCQPTVAVVGAKGAEHQHDILLKKGLNLLHRKLSAFDWVATVPR